MLAWPGGERRFVSGGRSYSGVLAYQRGPGSLKLSGVVCRGGWRASCGEARRRVRGRGDGDVLEGSNNRLGRQGSRGGESVL